MESFDYRRVMEVEDGVPWIIETAFGWCPAASARRLITGVNWSPGIVNPFRSSGSLRHEPGHPADPAACRGRRARHHGAALRLPTGRVHGPWQVRSGDGMKAAAIINAVQGVTKKWAKQRKAGGEAASAYLNRRRP